MYEYVNCYCAQKYCISTYIKTPILPLYILIPIEESLDLVPPLAKKSKLLHRKRKSKREDRIVAILAVLAGGGREVGCQVQRRCNECELLCIHFLPTLLTIFQFFTILYSLAHIGGGGGGGWFLGFLNLF